MDLPQYSLVTSSNSFKGTVSLDYFVFHRAASVGKVTWKTVESLRALIK